MNTRTFGAGCARLLWAVGLLSLLSNHMGEVAKANSSALSRVDPATGIAEQLACFPYVATLGNVPPGLPSDTTEFVPSGAAPRLRLTRVVRAVRRWCIH